MKEFDYYIFIDFSENLIGYNIIEKNKIRELLPKITKLAHYKDLKHKREYLSSMKKLFEREKIVSYLEKSRIKNIRYNLDIFIEVSEFIKKHENCIIFISIDNFQYNTFRKVINLVDKDKVEIVRESQLKKGSPEYRMSLIIDTQLNLVRRNHK
jgi:hypothetical protein